MTFLEVTGSFACIKREDKQLPLFFVLYGCWSEASIKSRTSFTWKPYRHIVRSSTWPWRPYALNCKGDEQLGLERLWSVRSHSMPVKSQKVILSASEPQCFTVRAESRPFLDIWWSRDAPPFWPEQTTQFLIKFLMIRHWSPPFMLSTWPSTCPLCDKGFSWQMYLSSHKREDPEDLPVGEETSREWLQVIRIINPGHLLPVSKSLREKTTAGKALQVK